MNRFSLSARFLKNDDFCAFSGDTLNENLIEEFLRSRIFKKIVVISNYQII